MSDIVNAMPMNILAAYNELLSDAAHCLRHIDAFDLLSGDSQSRIAWNALQARYREASLELIRFCKLHEQALFQQIEDATKPLP